MQPEYRNMPGQPYNPVPPQQPIAASQMKKHHPIGLILSVIVLTLMLIGTGAMALNYYGQAQDYKNNVDSKIDEALAAAVEESIKEQEAQFIEREKEPLQEYKGPEALGSIGMKYPKTWSAYIEEADGGTLINGYFHPDFIPGLNPDTAFALRLEVLEADYDEELGNFSRASQQGDVKVTAIKAVNVPSVTGARIDGEIGRDKQGSVVLFPLRDKTIRLTVETEKFAKDFNDIILKNFTFIP